ncbi:flagellar hook protein FlgE [Thioalkalivibrio sp. XN279]|uniref:flagellar hook protein FlgE n=1 Tax=Thioalkalivibrio sp. XN279 TaxID=2714953 RepID=UPI001407D696|nr:flagellar hook protein FlgE [Thioalkalivibrio sp. XN279]NHA13384.1 flagellar hook protein FlgE [Thioalkalivibrio sp. XN279]
MPFRTALSGLNAASADLRVTGNNIANASTTGFKQSRAEFADVFANSFSGIASNAIGTGVRLSSVAQQFGQGNIDFTGNNLDLALNGQGFFVLSEGGSRVYSRDGAFKVDRDGFVVNSSGQRLQAYPPGNADGSIFSTGVLGDLVLDGSEAAPQATSLVSATLNLRADATDLSGVAFDPADPETFSYTTSLTTYDSLGQSHTATLYFRNTGALTWEARVAVDGNVLPDTQPMTFNSDGTLASPAAPVGFGTFDPGNGATPLDIEFDFTSASQFGSVSNVTALTQDGFSTGRLSSVDIDTSGVVLARFTNGQSRALGQLALANFPNPQGLQQLGNNAWGDSFAAGEVVLGAGGAGSFGQVQSGGLEGSNVDLSEQLVGLITAQRNFQANAQVISTADAITQTIINLR